MKIGEVAKQAGVAVGALRYYESLGLIQSEHGENSYRYYAPETVQQVQFIKKAQVQAVSIFGGYRRQLQVVVDRQQLAAYGLSILQVRDAIDANNISQGAGVLTQGDSEILVRADKRALSAADVMDYLSWSRTARWSTSAMWLR
ncbi:efflux RND transporter permease subunit [Oscillatoria sp. CS-180]|uniref:efflux RND transporter permease subunit n=1 Tax=Oscillatoria sp. CS-180 TaxID=3021720 RepID=UPI00232D1D88|nr:efflux RND transporter permease subunit [Oscillatoria sp. CS-180]MDB9527907.1 efflux RND transporter permease subunit [Oscillatoria sp. CS-180]